MISVESDDADVAAYVGQKLHSYKYLEELKHFIFDQAIDGESFKSLTDEKLKSWGLTAGANREKLLALVAEIAHESEARFQNQSKRSFVIRQSLVILKCMRW